MRALIAGGAGFVGSHLCARLIDDGHDVVCLDSFATGAIANLDGLTDHPRFALRDHDVTRPIPELGRLDAILNLASPASPPIYLRRPLETALANSHGTYNLLELARATGARFLLASTSEVYGDPLEHPQAETYWGNVNPNGVRACYDESKRYAEMLTMLYWREFGLDARIVRIFNTYGPRLDPGDGRLVPNFIAQALRGEPITIYGDGHQTRSLCYVSDLVDGLVRAATAPGISGGVFNLGNPDERPVRDLAALVNDLCGRRSAIVYRPHISADDPRRRCPDITRARAILGWEPRVGLREGLVRTIDWFRERLGTAAMPA